ncbi:MAG: alpha/beta hydrolase [Rhodospirillales bacterium]
MFMTALPERHEIAGVTLEYIVKGQGQPILFLHAGHGVDADDPLVALLARTHRVYAVSHPGFGASTLPVYVTTVDDLAYIYLDLIEALDLRDVVLVGVSFGAWLAVEIATKGATRIAELVLIDAVGVKLSDRETRDILDIYATTIEEIPALYFKDEARGRAVMGDLDFRAMSEDAVTRFARNREAMVLFGWSPTLYNPKLPSRLHRITQRVLLLWGADDKVVSVDYGRRYARAFPDARIEVIDDAGHYGYLEQPAAFAARISTFLALQTVNA